MTRHVTDKVPECMSVRPGNGIGPGDDACTQDYLAVMYAGVVLGTVVADGIGGVADVQQPNPGGGAAGREVIGEVPAL